MYRTSDQWWRRAMELSSMGCTYINGCAWDVWLAFGRNVSVCLGAVDKGGEPVGYAAFLATPAASRDVAASDSVGILQTPEEEVEEDED
jgi:hypothetical protein